MFKISFIIIILWFVVRLRIKDLTVRTVFYVFSLTAFLIIVGILSIIY